jgi:F0F1-type ATP synthase membrane subunit b/b'
MNLPGGIYDTVTEWGSAGIGAGFGFFLVRWIAVFVAGRWDKKEAQLDAATQLLIKQLQEQVAGLLDRLSRIESDLADCKRMHAESEQQRLRLEGLMQGLGDARQQAALIIAAEKTKNGG